MKLRQLIEGSERGQYKRVKEVALQLAQNKFPSKQMAVYIIEALTNGLLLEYRDRSIVRHSERLVEAIKGVRDRSGDPAFQDQAEDVEEALGAGYEAQHGNIPSGAILRAKWAINNWMELVGGLKKNHKEILSAMDGMIKHAKKTDPEYAKELQKKRKIVEGVWRDLSGLEEGVGSLKLRKGAW